MKSYLMLLYYNFERNCLLFYAVNDKNNIPKKSLESHRENEFECDLKKIVAIM